MIIPCIAMDTKLCPECKGLGRQEIKIYPGDTPWMDIIGDKEGECSDCDGKGWKVMHEWRHAELLGV